VFTGASSYASARAFTAGFVPVAFVAAGLSLAGAVAGALIPRRPPAITTQSRPAAEPAAETDPNRPVRQT
jgi:hypothetical protein